jgi:hypothetical protein
MNTHLVTFLFFLIGFAFFAALYVFASFSYELVDGCLVLRRKILAIIPFGCRRIPVSMIIEIRKFGAKRDWLRGAEIYGKLFLRPGVLIMLRKGFCRRIYVTPSEPDNFIELLQTAQKKALSSGLESVR